MAKKNRAFRRSNDFPDIDAFPLYILNEAYDYYKELIRKNDVNIHALFGERFNMSPSKAAILVAASKFKYDMAKKGIV